MEGIEVENMEWEEATEAENILTFDIGIMPLTDDQFSRGKCGLKIIQYMACGIPCVASPVGANGDIIQDRVNGLLAGSSDKWLDKISSLIENSRLRERIGKEGRQTVSKSYSLQEVAPKLWKIYKKIVGK